MSVFRSSSTRASLAAIGVATVSFWGATMWTPSDATPSGQPAATFTSPKRVVKKFDSAPPGFRWATTNFPSNARGLTYGSVAAAQTPAQMPDLIAATGIEGISGFVRKSDYLTVEPIITSPEQAVDWQQRLDSGYLPSVPVYDISGVNQVDIFQFSPTRDSE